MQRSLRSRLQHPVIRDGQVRGELFVEDIFRGDRRRSFGEQHRLHAFSGQRLLGQSTHSQILFPGSLPFQYLRWFRRNETSGPGQNFVDVFAPTEIPRAADSALPHSVTQFGRTAGYNHSLGQQFRRKARKIECGIAADFPVHRQIGGNNRQLTGHRLYQRMSEGLGIRGSYIAITRPVQMASQFLTKNWREDRYFLRVSPSQR